MGIGRKRLKDLFSGLRQTGKSEKIKIVFDNDFDNIVTKKSVIFHSGGFGVLDNWVNSPYLIYRD